MLYMEFRYEYKILYNYNNTNSKTNAKCQTPDYKIRHPPLQTILIGKLIVMH